MRQGLLGAADVDILLRHGRGELEGGLGRHARDILLEGVEATSHGLVGGHHAHVEVLLLCSLDLLLLLLQQLDLLLDGELLHCIKEKEGTELAYLVQRYFCRVPGSRPFAFEMVIQGR